jgi:hypothetical protein
MGNYTAYITVGKPKSTGAIFYAPAGSTLPTAADAELDEAFVCVGTIGDDGLTRKIKRSMKDIKDWGGNTVKVVQTDVKETFSFTMIEALNLDVQKVVYGEDNVGGVTNTGMVAHTSAEPVEHAWVIDQILDGGSLLRIVIPHGKITELSDVAFKVDQAIGYGVTITALSDTAGTTSIDYISMKA